MSINKFSTLPAAVVLSILLGLVGFNCTREYVHYDKICFEREVQPILSSNCTQSGCHNAADRQGGRDYSTYDGIMRDVSAGNYRSSSLYQVIATSLGGSAMPPKPYDRLSTDQIKIIATWIEEGATNDTCSTAITCDTTGAVSYASQVKPILVTNCNGCHGGSSPSGNISYSSYGGVKTTALNGTLVGSINHASGFSAMPQNANKLSNCEIAIIQKWVTAGAPNN